MASFSPASYKLLAFDIYGTLIDWEGGIYTHLLPLLSTLPSTSPHHPSRNDSSTTRTFILSSYTKLEVETQKKYPTLAYPGVLSLVYKSLASQLGVEYTESEADEFGQSIGKWPAFPDTIEAMKILGKYYKLVVLSNVSRSSFSQTLSGPLNGVKFDAIYTAEDIGSYKPDLNNFKYLVENVKKEFGVEKDEILMVAQSLFHDHVQVKKMGMRPSVWVSRLGKEGGEPMMGGKIEEMKEEVDLVGIVPDLATLAEAVEKCYGVDGKVTLK